MAQAVSSIVRDPQIEAARVPPQSIEAEQSVLGGLMLDNSAWKIFQIAEAGAKAQQGFVKIDPLLTETVERIDMLYSRENKNDVIGVPTSFVDLDRMTSGLQPGELIIIAGRPSMGKTALAMN